MKKNAFLVLPALFLTACLGTTSTVLFRPGTSVEQQQRDLDACKIASFQNIPQTLQTNVSGGYYHSGKLKCRTDGNGKTSCQRVGEYYQPPTAITFDRNDALRWRFVKACLQEKGYSIANNVPRCRNDADRLRASAATSIAELVCDPEPVLDY